MKFGRLVIALFAVFSLVVATAAPAVAGTPPPDGTGGPGGCGLSGTMQFKPALVNGGTAPTAVKLKLKTFTGGECQAGTGDGANVATLQLSGSGTSPDNNCFTFLSQAMVGQTHGLALAETIKWKMRKGSTPSKISNSSIHSFQFRSYGLNPPGSNVPHIFLNISQSDGAVIASGSFKTHDAVQLFETDQDANEITTACAGKGIKKLTFGVKASKDDLVKGIGVVDIF